MNKMETSTIKKPKSSLHKKVNGMKQKNTRNSFASFKELKKLKQKKTS